MDDEKMNIFSDNFVNQFIIQKIFQCSIRIKTIFTNQ